MTMEYVSLQPNMTVEEAYRSVSARTGVDKETIYTCYVMADDRKLVGIVTVQDLLLADDDAITRRDIMETNVIFVQHLDGSGRGGQNAEQIRLPGHAGGG